MGAVHLSTALTIGKLAGNTCTSGYRCRWERGKILDVLIIRDSQMRQLREAQLAQWIVAALRRSLPQAAAHVSTSDMARLAQNAISAGRELGLRYDEDLLLLARVHLLLGSNFATDPRIHWTQAYLDDWDPDVGERIARLEAEVSRRYAEASL